MTRTVRDWGIFSAVHLVLIIENLLAPNGPLGDVLYTYPQWIGQGISGGGWQGLTAEGVYPFGALIPMYFGALGVIGWFGFVVVVNAVAFSSVRERSPRAALAWLGFLALLGPIAIGRIDVFTVALGVVVIALTDSNPRLAGALIAVATWVKVWPIVLGLSSLLTTRARTIANWAFGTAAAVGLAGVIIGGVDNVFSFLGDQQGRGIQVEAVAAALTLIELLALGALAARIVLLRIRMVGEITTHILGLALTTLISLLIVFNKVGSPQFVSWLGVAVIALVFYWHPRWSPILLALIGAIAFLTHVLYPYAYFDFLALEPAPLALITARNICEVVLFTTAAIALLVELRVEELANEGRDRLIVDEEGVVPERG